MDKVDIKVMFVKHVCPNPNHFCNGQHIPDMDGNGNDKSKAEDHEPCMFFSGGMCLHPRNPGILCPEWIEYRNKFFGVAPIEHL